MTTAQVTPASSVSAIPARLAAGVAGGLAGGVVFGMLMQMMEMMPMVASLVGSESVAVGWLTHLAISAFIGAVFALLLAPMATGLSRAIEIGVGYGIAWWVLGALVLMPARLGMDLFMLNTMTGRSLMGHVIYGAILGAFYALLAPRLIRR